MTMNLCQLFWMATFCRAWNSHARIYKTSDKQLLRKAIPGDLGVWTTERTELAPIYLTLPLSTTSFKARIISSLGVCRSRRWMYKTSIYVPRRLTLSSTASMIFLRDSPTRFTQVPSLFCAKCSGVWPPSSSIPANSLVLITTRCRGMLYFFNAFPTMISETPLE